MNITIKLLTVWVIQIIVVACINGYNKLNASKCTVCVKYHSYKSNIGIIVKLFICEVISNLIYSYLSDLVQIHLNLTGINAISMKEIYN